MNESLLASLRTAIVGLHHAIRAMVVHATESESAEKLAEVARDDDGDTIYAIDEIGEADIKETLGLWALEAGVHLNVVGEGIASGMARLECRNPAAETWRVIVDPIDGTRGVMFQKRSAWILTAAAPDRGDRTSLTDTVLAVQTEIPLVKQHLSDELSAVRGRGATIERYDRLTRTRRPIRLLPSRAKTLAHGFAQIARFFPGGRAVLAEIDDEIIDQVVGPPVSGKARSFEDQYLSTGGQLYELLAGKDRFTADLRPLVFASERARGRHPGIAVHPYDISTALIAEELGVILTDPAGRRLDCPLTIDADVAWVGYANADLRSLIEPVLRAALEKRGLLS